MPIVHTNNVPRDVLDSSDLTAKERESFDYLDWSKLDTGEESASFFRYRGQAYDLGEFMNGGLGAIGWQGHQSDTFFSATVIRFVEDGERLIVGRIYS